MGNHFFQAPNVLSTTLRKEEWRRLNNSSLLDGLGHTNNPLMSYRNKVSWQTGKHTFDLLALAHVDGSARNGKEQGSRELMGIQHRPSKMSQSEF